MSAKRWAAICLGIADAPDIVDYTRYFELPSPLTLRLELEYGGLELAFRIDCRADFNSFLMNSYNTNIPFVQNGYDAIADVNMPSVGYLDCKSDHFRGSVGRRTLAWGPATYGLAIGDGAISMDSIWLERLFRVQSGDFRFIYVLVGAVFDGAGL